jgi:hypothetical protein
MAVLRGLGVHEQTTVILLTGYTSPGKRKPLATDPFLFSILLSAFSCTKDSHFGE